MGGIPVRHDLGHVSWTPCEPERQVTVEAGNLYIRGKAHHLKLNELYAIAP